MNRGRRSFVKTTAVAGAGAAIAGSMPGLLQAATATKSPTPLKILILGGTAFLGPQIVEAAKARGHVLTLFNRGKTNPGLFPDLEKLHGDRDGDLKSLEGRTWDAAIDTSGYVPRIVSMSATLLAPSVKRYLFISTSRFGTEWVMRPTVMVFIAISFATIVYSIWNGRRRSVPIDD